MSEIILDTITGKSTATTITIGSTPVVSASANSMTIRGEGTAQTSIQQGLAKAWVRFNASSGTPTINDGLNASSFTDHAVGKHTLVFTNSMGNVNYTWSCGGSNTSTDSRYIFNNNAAPATASFRFITTNDSTSARDGTDNSVIIHGDLA
jgi:hypothetical protein